jgi:hypothetical protein
MYIYIIYFSYSLKLEYNIPLLNDTSLFIIYYEDQTCPIDIAIDYMQGELHIPTIYIARALVNIMNQLTMYVVLWPTV